MLVGLLFVSPSWKGPPMRGAFSFWIYFCSSWWAFVVRLCSWWRPPVRPGYFGFLYLWYGCVIIRSLKLLFVSWRRIPG